MNRDIKEYIIQIILIVFSVVLGLFLNEKIVQRNEQIEAEKLLSFIKSEINSNRLIMKDWGPYHREMRNNLDSLKRQESFVNEFIADKDVFYENMMTRGTFMREQPVDAAWEIAKSNSILFNIGFEKMLLLSRIYYQQSITFPPMMEMFDLLTSKGVNAPNDAKENLDILSNQMQELVGREMSLMYGYEQAAEMFNLPDTIPTKSIKE